MINEMFLILKFPISSFPSYGVYISQLIRFARVCSNVDDFNKGNLFLTAKLKEGYRYHKFSKAFYKFYHRHSRVNCYIQYWFKNSSATGHIRIYILW